MRLWRPYIICGLLTLCSCREKPHQVALYLKVTDSAGKNVPGAELQLDGQVLAQSDFRGEIRVRVHLLSTMKAHLVVSKEHPTIDYSKDSQWLKFNDENSRIINLKSVLFAVPKTPKAPEATAAAALDSTTNIQPTEDIPSANQEAQSTAVDFQASLLETPPQLDSIPASEVSPEDEHELLTMHATNQGAPLGGVRFYMVQDSSSRLLEICTSAANGRCLALIHGELGTNIRLYARKPGFATERQTTILRARDNVHFGMRLGQSLEILALSSRFGRAEVVANAAVSLGGRDLGLSDSLGIFLADSRLDLRRFATRNDTLQLSADGLEQAQAQLALPPSIEPTVRAWFYPKSPYAARIVFRPLRLPSMLPAPWNTPSARAQLSEALQQNLPAYLSMVDKGLSQDTLATLLGRCDFVLAPEVIADGQGLALRQSLTDLQGRVLSTRSLLLPTSPTEELDAKIQESRNLLWPAIPWEGLVVAQTGESLTIRFHPQLHLSVGQKLRLYSTAGSSQSAELLSIGEVISADPGIVKASLRDASIPIPPGSFAVAGVISGATLAAHAAD